MRTPEAFRDMVNLEGFRGEAKETRLLFEVGRGILCKRIVRIRTLREGIVLIRMGKELGSRLLGRNSIRGWSR
jgi:hypothetical protein